MQKAYDIVLVTVDGNMCDSLGKEYPKSGFIESEDFDDKKTISNGLFGVISAETSVMFDDTFEYVLVVKIDKHQPKILVDEHYNLIKFKQGLVSFCGSLSEAAQFVKDEINPHISTVGRQHYSEDCCQISMLNGYGSTIKTSAEFAHAINSGDKGIARTEKEFSHATVLGQKGRALTLEEESHALAFGKKSKVRVCSGKTAVCLEEESEAVAMGEDALAVCLGVDSEAGVGYNGIVVLGWHDGQRRRVAVGYAGEDLEAGQMYHIKGGKFVLS
jgi:hypothetical protein